VAYLTLASLQPDARRSGKIALKLTWRAWRILAVTIAFCAGLWLFEALRAPSLSIVFAVSSLTLAMAPLAIVMANACLSPYERHTQQRYRIEAEARLASIRPFIVGITGSYGKSSTKAMLAHFLQFKAPTLAATGSINTVMGLTRHIREALVPGHEFMVVEMGAFHPGSIRRLCEFTPPSAAIITAVGDMHLERFGSLDGIVQAKRELAEALPDDGLLVVNADSPGALSIAKKASRRCVLLYGEASTERLATRLGKVIFTKEGTRFTLETETRTFDCFTPLHGRPIVSNIAGAFTLAVALGVDPDVVVAAIRTLRPVSNRLEVVDDKGVVWIRDAYNSNQVGFRAALEVAAALPAAHRYLVTPGVIELGAEQHRVNRALSKEAAGVCDRTLVVSPTNREAFVLGHQDARQESRLVVVANRREAFAWTNEHVRSGDLVILENDLPDLYERSDARWWKW
jgi:UDP-N-acetylmuramoyl-tripeptide--D-alanyl-D-alanine ligase